MKLFKQYIFESDQKKELFHSFFVSKAGKIIEPTSTPLSGTKVDIDHVYIPLNQPHDFDMTDRQMDDILELSDLEKLEIYKTGKGPLDASVDRRLSSRGFIRAINSGWGNSSTRRITLAATTTGTHDRHHLDDLTPAIKAVRERLPDHRDWQIKIYGLKFHEPHELETMRHRLSPVHIKQLTDGSELDLMNTDEIDRFIHGRGSLSRDPGSGVHGVPSPEEMRRKAGRTDEPESIQRGRFFQSDSYYPIKSFAKYITEFTDHEGYEGNTLFAISPDGKLHTKDTPKGQIREHPDAFPELNFGRATSWEYDMGMGHAHRERPEPIAHGRINHEKKMIQIITKHGGPAAYGDDRILPAGGSGARKLKRDVEEDSYNRLATLKYLKPYKDYSIYVSHTEAYPVLHSFTEHERYLMELLK